jgi:hypothetical protein
VNVVVVIPGCEAYAGVGEICLRLLERYWAGHPQVKKVPMNGGPWLGPVVEALREESDDLFVLMLDDYAICGDVKAGMVERAKEVMLRDRSIGLFPLCWYPASRRGARAGENGIVTLGGAPVLLQAGIWRREWFLELAAGIDPRASASGFEAAATQIVRKGGRDICAFDMDAPQWVGGSLVDGFDKAEWPVPYHNLMHRGQPALEHEKFLRSEGYRFPARGLGDSIARIAEATGIGAVARMVEQVSGQPCGCEGRREKLNEWMPYG